jgi:hypothetical protein
LDRLEAECGEFSATPKLATGAVIVSLDDHPGRRGSPMDGRCPGSMSASLVEKRAKLSGSLRSTGGGKVPQNI